MAAISATSYATPSTQALLQQTQLQQARQSAAQSQAQADQLRLEARQAQQEAQKWQREAQYLAAQIQQNTAPAESAPPTRPPAPTYAANGTRGSDATNGTLLDTSA